MSACCDPGGYRKIFGSRAARRDASAYRKNGLDGTARDLVDQLRRSGIEGATILEIGGGVGGIQLELLRSGAAGATNVELSPEYEPEARELAAEAGAADQVARVLGDFAAVADGVAPADVVVLHRVVCCYPALEGLLAPAAARARRALALTYPRSRRLTRWGVRIVNFALWLTRNSFRAYVHPPARIERVATDAGMRPVFRRQGLIWESAVYERVKLSA